MNCKVVHVEKENKDHPGLTIYTLERKDDINWSSFLFKVKMWDNGMFTIKSLEDKQIGYSTELRNSALKAIEEWKFKQSLSPKTVKTFEDIIDEL
jgi:hypothetical protein